MPIWKTGLYYPPSDNRPVPHAQMRGRITFPYWRGGHVVYMIGRSMDDNTAKYVKCMTRNEDSRNFISPHIRNEIFNGDILHKPLDYVVICEGVTDCIAAMDRGIPAISPVTTTIKRDDWSRIISALKPGMNVYLCNDNEESGAGAKGALATAKELIAHGFIPRVVNLPRDGHSKMDLNLFFMSHDREDFMALLETAQHPSVAAVMDISPDASDEEIVAELGHILHNTRGLEEPMVRAAIKSRFPSYSARMLDKATREARPKKDVQSSNGKPGIVVNNRQPDDIKKDAVVALKLLNESAPDAEDTRPILFLQESRIVRILDGSISRVNVDAMTSILARAANWFRVTGSGQQPTLVPPFLPKVIIADTKGCVFPELEEIKRTPVFGRDGTLLKEPGYVPSERIWLDLPRPVLDILRDYKPMAPEQAVEILYDAIADFPFVSQADRATSIGAMVLPFVRNMITGPTPLHMIEAPTPGSGKTLLATLISIISTGEPAATHALPQNEDEIRKMITSELLANNPIILLDNANERTMLNSPSLASCLTSERPSDRELGATKIIAVKNHAVWIMTGNNTTLSTELSRRAIRARINPGVVMPYTRDPNAFRHPMLLEWARSNRPKLLRAALSLVSCWVESGSKPFLDISIGGYESWSRVIGGILEASGVEGFLAAQMEFYKTADVEGAAWREFTSVWASLELTSTNISAWSDMQKLVSMCRSYNLLGEVLSRAKTQNSEIQLMARELKRIRDMRFDDLMVEHEHGRARIVRVSENGEVSLDNVRAFQPTLSGVSGGWNEDEESLV